MLRGAALASPSTDGWDVGFVTDLLGAISARSKLDQCVQGNIHPGALGLILLHEVSIHASQYSLVSDDEDVLATLKFHDDGLKTDDNVAIRLSATVAVVVLVFITCGKVLRVSILNLLVSQTVADTRVKFVKCLPLKLVVVRREEARSCNGSSQSRGPYCKGAIILKSVRGGNGIVTKLDLRQQTCGQAQEAS